MINRSSDVTMSSSLVPSTASSSMYRPPYTYSTASRQISTYTRTCMKNEEWAGQERAC